MNQNPEWSAQNSLPPSASAPIRRKLQTNNPVLDIARIGAFSALVTVGTVLSNVLFGITLPATLGEITAARAFYLALAVLFSRKVSFWSTAIGSGVGEAISIFVFG